MSEQLLLGHRNILITENRGKRNFWKNLQFKTRACQVCKKQVGKWGNLWISGWHEPAVRDCYTHLCGLKYCSMLAVERTFGEVMGCTFFHYHINCMMKVTFF